MKKLDAQFIQLPMQVVTDPAISSTDKLVLGLIISLHWIKGYAYPSNRYLGAILSCSDATVSASISRLRDCGWIHIDRPGGFQRRITPSSEALKRMPTV